MPGVTLAIPTLFPGNLPFIIKKNGGNSPIPTIQNLKYKYLCFHNFIIIFNHFGMELRIFLPQPPKSWDYRCALQCLAIFIL
jgi:hypothetical protein